MFFNPCPALYFNSPNTCLTRVLYRTSTFFVTRRQLSSAFTRFDAFVALSCRFLDLGFQPLYRLAPEISQLFSCRNKAISGLNDLTTCVKAANSEPQAAMHRIFGQS